MKQEEPKKLNYSSLDLIIFAWKKRTTILIVGFIAAVASVIVSYQITPLFKSEVVMFAPSSTPISKYLFSQNYVADHGLLSFGEEEQIEQLIQVLQSNQIRNKIISDYNLLEHYEIDTSEKYRQFKLYEKYSKNISFRRTKYLSVVIEVVDKDPQIASDIANSIADYVDTAIYNIQHDRAFAAYNILIAQRNEISANIREFDDSIKYLNEQGMFSYENQTERLSEAYAYALKDGNTGSINRLKKEMDHIAKYASEYMSIRDRVNYQKSQLDYINQRIYETKTEIKQVVPQHFTVDRAYPADKKFYPKKSIIVLTTIIVSVVLAYILLLIIDAIKRYKSVYEID